MVWCVGDGITDSAGAIQAAIDYVSSRKGGTVYLPVGQYYISTQLILKSNVSIKGAGGLRWPDNSSGSIIIAAPNTSAFYTGYEDGHSGWVRNIHLSDFTIQGDTLATTIPTYGIYGANLRYGVVFERLQVSGFNDCGIYLKDNWFMNMYDVRCMHNAECGVKFDKRANNVNMIGCTFNNNGANGVDLSNYESVLIQGCLIENNVGSGIITRGGQSLTISGNYMEQNGGLTTIYIRSDLENRDLSVNIIGNRILGNSNQAKSQNGVYIRSYARNVQVTGNWLSGFPTACIAVEGSQYKQNVVIYSNEYDNSPIPINKLSPDRTYQPLIIESDYIDFGNRTLENYTST